VSSCGRYLVYALGSNLVVRNLSNDKQCFLAGHSGKITCLAASNDGHKLASGQANHSGVKVRMSVLFLCDFAGLSVGMCKDEIVRGFQLFSHWELHISNTLRCCLFN
jgi:hypothetical protein